MDKLIRWCGSLVALSLAIACSRSPNEPDVTAASFAGRWGGYYRLISWDPPHSGYHAGTQRNIIVDIDGSGLTASVRTDAFFDVTSPFTGQLQGDGSIVFTPASSSQLGVDITRIVLRRLAPGRLTGELTYTSDFPIRTFQAAIDQMTRVAAPPAPGPVSALAGSWEGLNDFAASYTLCAGPPAMCSGRFPFPRAASYTLRIVPASSGYDAQLVVSHENGTHRFRTTGQPSGAGISFNPVTMPADPDGVSQLLSVFQVQLDSGGGLTGLIEYTTTGPLGSATRRIEIRRGARADSVRLPGSFQGIWNGRSFTRSCSGDCAGLPSSNFVSFDLSQRGTEIVGSSSLIPEVRGTATGDRAVLAGDDTRACGFGNIATCTRRLSALTVTVDSLGLMQGTFTLEVRDGNEGRAYTIQGELFDAVRLPALIRR